MSNRQNKSGPEILLEFQRIGKLVRVVAVDPQTGIEVTIVGAADAGEALLSRIAAQKLTYVLNKRAARQDRRPGRGWTA